eukprot:TRINITY_DN4783_c0_g1_i3.p1 TRINITY_DN4783_c0_g1~~TRINITY_DN4783_c0_g1_i3.p1  ORF type:complete len:189 (-),score=46.94 TRINITY_DN4783_c0_g1_i3:153-719(-)
MDSFNQREGVGPMRPEALRACIKMLKTSEGPQTLSLKYSPLGPSMLRSLTRALRENPCVSTLNMTRAKIRHDSWDAMLAMLATILHQIETLVWESDVQSNDRGKKHDLIRTIGRMRKLTSLVVGRGFTCGHFDWVELLNTVPQLEHLRVVGEQVPVVQAGIAEPLSYRLITLCLLESSLTDDLSLIHI